MGEIIASLRRKAGYTQASLAKELHITDKAVSNWERGISRPDSSLLHKLSLLLGADLEVLLNTEERNTSWHGLIDLREYEVDLCQRIITQPLIDFLLVYYLLLDIKNIHVVTSSTNHAFLRDHAYQQLGFSMDFETPYSENLFIINKPVFLFGSNLTMIFQSSMTSDLLVKLAPCGKEAPILLCPAEYASKYIDNPHQITDEAMLRTLGRGMVCIDMHSSSGMLDVANFLHIYKKNSGTPACCLEEISYRKGLITRAELLKICNRTGNAEYLRRLVYEETDLLELP